MLNNNYLRALPYELGKLFQLATLGLKVCLSDWEFSFIQYQIFVKSRFKSSKSGQSPWVWCAAVVLWSEWNKEAFGLHAWQPGSVYQPPAVQAIIEEEKQEFCGYSVFFLSGPGSSYSLWTGQTLPPFSQSCATTFFVTGDTIFYTQEVFQIQKEMSVVSNFAFAQVCDAQPVWLLPTVGSKLGVQVEQKRHLLRTFISKSPMFQEERHFGRGAPLCSWHHRHAGGWFSSSKHDI